MKFNGFRPVLFVITFMIGFWVAPIRFTSIVTGSGALTGGNNSCRFSIYSSDYFEELSRWSCAFESESLALEYFESLSPANRIILENDSYLLFQIAEPRGDFYCSSRHDGRIIINICSHSIKHILEYERQFARDH